MLELRLVDSVAEVGAEKWSELQGPLTYPFLRYEWLHALEESGCLGREKGWIPRFLVCKQGKELVAVVPAYLKLDSYGEFVFDHAWAQFCQTRLGRPYYPKLVIAVPFTPATGSRVLFAQGTSLADREEVFDLLTGGLPELAKQLGLSSVHILFPSDADGHELRQRDWVERLGVQFQFHAEGLADFDEFLGTFRAKRRAAIRREQRALDDQGIEIRVCTASGLLARHSEIAYRLYVSTVDKYFYGRRYLNRPFFDQVIQTMPDSLHFVLAQDADENVLGGAFNLLGSEALYGRYWGAFSDVPFLHFNVCLYAGVRETLRLGLSKFEPGAGGAHKESRGFRPTITRSFHYLADPTLAQAVEDFCLREAEAVQCHVEKS